MAHRSSIAAGVAAMAILFTTAFNNKVLAAGSFGGDVLALQLDVDFSDAGVMPGALGLPCGDLVLTLGWAASLQPGVRITPHGGALHSFRLDPGSATPRTATASCRRTEGKSFRNTSKGSPASKRPLGALATQSRDFH